MFRQKIYYQYLESQHLKPIVNIMDTIAAIGYLQIEIQ